MTLKEWKVVECMELISKQLVASEFIETLAKKIMKLMPHSYITKQQSANLTKRKDFDKTYFCILVRIILFAFKIKFKAITDSNEKFAKSSLIANCNSRCKMNHCIEKLHSIHFNKIIAKRCASS